MSKIEIIAAGQLKKGPLKLLCDEYMKRLQWPVKIHEIESRKKDPGEMQAEEWAKTEKLIRPDSHVIALDERGKSLASVEFARTLERVRVSGKSPIQFVIGGANGLSPFLRKRGDLILSFGAQTWPHMLARVMLLEQIYRAQQILSGHPYHRE